jgi:tRNA threonylcarbamoyladenosine biosynthesis protein TsaB
MAMRILALDTTTRTSSCALVESGRTVREVVGDVSTPLATRVPGDLMRLLERDRVALESIDAFAVAIGPGSYTGLRIGIATMQGLASVQGKPLVGVSGLDALAALVAETVSPGALVVPWVDAWRGEVYASRYVTGEAGTEPEVVRPEEWLQRLLGTMPVGGNGDDPVIFIGDGALAHRQLIAETFGDRGRIAEPASPALAGVIGRLACDVLATGARPRPDEVQPLYVRRPDVEVSRDKTRALGSG